MLKMTSNGVELTADDLIVEYMLYKVLNGYEPMYTLTEFMDFLNYFRKRMKVVDVLDDKYQLFYRFFERKGVDDWYHIIDFKTKTGQVKNHIDFYQNENEGYLKANYLLSKYDALVINSSIIGKERKNRILSIIKKYLENEPKREINYNIKYTEDELLIGKYITAELLDRYWQGYIEKSEYRRFLVPYSDIKHLFDKATSYRLGVNNLRLQLFDFYDVMSERLTLMYKQDKNLRISKTSRSYLANANYNLFTKGYEKDFDYICETQNLFINLSKLKFHNGKLLIRDDEKVKKIVKQVEYQKTLL